MEDIHKLEVHKGRKPTVEIHCYDETPYEEREKNPDLPPYQYSIQLCFTGDMERQKFIDMVWEYHCEQEGGGADEEEKEGILGAVEEEDESSEEEDLQESEEEIGKPTIYDWCLRSWYHSLNISTINLHQAAQRPEKVPDHNHSRIWTVRLTKALQLQHTCIR